MSKSEVKKKFVKNQTINKRMRIQEWFLIKIGIYQTFDIFKNSPLESVIP